MKFKLVLLLVFTLNVGGICQEFAPIGSTWHFPVSNWVSGSVGVLTIATTGDTIINNKECKVLYRDRNTMNGDQGNIYLHQNLDTIFQFDEDENKFDKIIVFNSEIGDTFIIEKQAAYQFGDTMHCKIDSISYFHIPNGDSIKIQHVEFFASRVLDSGDTIQARKNGELIDNIGFKNALIPLVLESLAVGTAEENIRCYEDDNIGLVMFGEVDCLFTSLNNLREEYKTILFPNPTKEMLYIESGNSDIKGIQIFDISGQLMFKTWNSITEVNLSKLVKGIYVVRVELDQHIEHHKIVIQ